MRGTPEQVASDIAWTRFIPARAGNTLALQQVMLTIAVHPRACGEHLTVSANVTGVNGSSPRVRGTLDCVAAHREHERFIPARAGNTIAGINEGNL